MYGVSHQCPGVKRCRCEGEVTCPVSVPAEWAANLTSPGVHIHAPPDKTFEPRRTQRTRRRPSLQQGISRQQRKSSLVPDARVATRSGSFPRGGSQKHL